MKILFIADKFDDEQRDEESKFPGGAELSNAALIESSPWEIEKIKIAEVRFEFIKEFDIHIIGNSKTITKSIINSLVESGKHILLEHDNRICRYDGDFSRARKEPVHYYFHRCICPHLNYQQLYRSALGTIFHTRKQLSVYKKNPFFKTTNIEILGCAAMNQTFISRVERFRNKGKVEKNGTAIFRTPHYYKGYERSRDFCVKRGVQPVEISDISPDEVLDIFERSEQFVYLPNGIEWAGRMPVEARFLGCKVIINENVGVGGEPWWGWDDDRAFEFLKKTPERFWKIVKKLVDENTD